LRVIASAAKECQQFGIHLYPDAWRSSRAVRRDSRRRNCSFSGLPNTQLSQSAVISRLRDVCALSHQRHRVRSGTHAALAWTGGADQAAEEGLPNDICERVRTQLSEKEFSDLTFLVMSVNAWNRINIGFKTVPGSSGAALGPDKAQLS
jgi:hypothetical protein